MERLRQLGGTAVALIVGGGVALGCGSNVQWEPAQIPPETLVAPPNVPGEGEGSELAGAFDDIEPIDAEGGDSSDSGDETPAPEPPAPDAPTPESAPEAAPKAAPKAPAPKAPKAPKGTKPAPAPAPK